MARLGRSPSRAFYSQYDSANAVLAATLVGMGCSCGAAEQLEHERLKLVALTESITERSELLMKNETGAQGRVQELDASMETLLLSEVELQERRVHVDAKLLEMARIQHESGQRDEGLRCYEEELQQQEVKLHDLEQETISHEEAVAKEELALMEERNRLEDEIEQLRQQCAPIDAKATALSHECEDYGRRHSQVEHDKRMLESDRELLAEIDKQVEPIRRNLAEREVRLKAAEIDVDALEVSCNDREAQLLPEYQRCIKSLSVLEERARELRVREEESRQQQLALLQRQRKLGGAEVRLSGLEGALQQQSSGLIPSRHGLEMSADIGGMRERLARLRDADAKWVERISRQQHEIQRLEARIEHVEAQHGFRPPSRLPKDECAKRGDDGASAKISSGLAIPRPRNGKPALEFVTQRQF